MIAAALVGGIVLLSAWSIGAWRPRTVGFDTDPRPKRRNLTLGRQGRRRMLVAAIVVAALLDPWLAGIVGGLVLAGPTARRALVRRSRQRAISQQMPDAIDLLVLVVRAGMTPHHAVRWAARRAPPAIRPGFAAVVHHIDRGAPLAEAVVQLAATLGPAFGPVADTIAASERYGTPMSRTTEQLAADARERRRRLAEADARRLPVRMAFPLVCCTLPSFVLVAIVPAVLGALTSLTESGL